MNTPNTARTFVLAQLLLMLATYLLVPYVNQYLSNRGDVASALTWVVISGISAVILYTIYSVQDVDARRPFPIEHAVRRRELRGIVPLDADTFEGPDGRPCVVAVRVDPLLASQNRSLDFSLDVVGEVVRVQLDEKERILAHCTAETWTRTAARPRSFGGGAWAPDLVDETRFDWVCVRPGDYVAIRGAWLGWSIEPGRDGMRTVVIRLARNSSGALAFEIIHPGKDVEWRKRELLRTAAFACLGMAGIAALAWTAVAFEHRDLLSPLPWLVFAVAVVLFMPLIAAHVAGWHRLSPWDASPPPWCEDAAKDNERTPYR